ncbi:MAG TPA: YggS family pyridoxal phosphate-dependent enzyme [Ignavibacteriaceae bacterium]|nr:YggS family pyridoxal phosphate-dependent enzyme [Ignavibacteriaceae bacterium]
MKKQNIRIIQEEIMSAAISSNRKIEEIKLVAVSKTFSVDEILTVYDEGLFCFGENKAQELAAKAKELSTKKIEWHFIGHLQSNKVKYVVPVAEYIHSIDSLKIAMEIEKVSAKIGKTQKVLLEIKTSEEESKYGLTNKNEIFGILNYISKSTSLDFQGLMTIAPFVEDEKLIRNSFVSLRNLKEEIEYELKIDCKHLSMGMTSDFKIAIEEGATILRIGSAIFGDRIYNPIGFN